MLMSPSFAKKAANGRYHDVPFGFLAQVDPPFFGSPETDVNRKPLESFGLLIAGPRLSL